VHGSDHGDAVGVGEHALALVVHRDVVEQLQAHVPELRLLQQVNQLRDEPLPHEVRPVHESGPFRAVHLSRHKWPGGLVN